MPFDVFQGGAVQNAYIGYVNYTQNATPTANSLDPFLGTNNLALIWPTTYQPGLSWNVVLGETVGNPVVSAYMDIAVLGTGRTVTLPDATQAPIGMNFIISNVSSQTTYVFNILNHGGTNIQTAAQNLDYYFILTDNSTANGAWDIVVFGAGSAPVVTGLVGFGLTGPYTPAGQVNQINAYFNAALVNATDAAPTYQATVQDWGKYFVANTTSPYLTQFILPSVSTIPAGFYLYINNLRPAPGQLVIATSSSDTALINGASSITLNANQTIGIVYTGLTVGGHLQFYTVNTPQLTLPLSIANGGTGQNTALAAFTALAPDGSNGQLMINSAGNYTTLNAPTKVGSVLSTDNVPFPAWGGNSIVQVQNFSYSTEYLVAGISTNFTITPIQLQFTPVYSNSQIWVTFTICLSSSTNSSTLLPGRAQLQRSAVAVPVPAGVPVGNVGGSTGSNFIFGGMANNQFITYSGTCQDANAFVAGTPYVYALWLNQPAPQTDGQVWLNSCYNDTFATGTSTLVITEIGGF